MNIDTKKERFRPLSIIALIIGLLSFVPVIIIDPIRYLLLDLGMVNFLRSTSFLITYIYFIFPIIAVVCGSIDLCRIKMGLYSNKGKGFDITGIVFGSLYIIAFVILNLWLHIF